MGDLTNFIPISDYFQKFKNNKVPTSENLYYNYQFYDEEIRSVVILFSLYFPPDNTFLNIYTVTNLIFTW